MKSDKRSLYEGMYILSATLSDDSRTKAFEKIVKGIEDKGGEVKKVHDLGRKKLAYSIKGRREGHYYVVFFEVVPSSVAALWTEYHLHEDLVRFSTMKVEKVQESLEFSKSRVS